MGLTDRCARRIIIYSRAGIDFMVSGTGVAAAVVFRSWEKKLMSEECSICKAQLAGEPWGFSNRMTSRSLEAIGNVGGSRCCKRDSYLSVLSAIDFVKEHFGIEMKKADVICEFSAQNNQCIGKRCPFSKANH